jgi:hypothetical protein
VDFALFNPTDLNMQQYSTRFHLPDGCFISDYYLEVNGKKKKGILTEKHAALWVYQEIISTNRDPGMLYYQNGNEINFSVFPFNACETRHTGIEFLHKEPLVLKIDSKEILLGDTSAVKLNAPVFLSKANAVYIPQLVKAALPEVQRRPYYHFIVDGSVNTQNEKEDMIRRIETFLGRKLISNKDGLVSCANYRIETTSLNANWQEKLKAFPAEGGFFAERAIQKGLWENYSRQKPLYPVFILVTDSLERAVFTDALKDLQFTFPESSDFFLLKRNGNLVRRSFWEDTLNSQDRIVKSVAPHPVKEYRSKNITAYLPMGNEGNFIVPESSSLDLPADELSLWDHAMSLQALHQRCLLHPELSESRWLNLVKASFETHVMLPATSFIVVENQAQEQALLEKQRQILHAKKTLDASEDIHMMSEPGLWIPLLICALLLFRKMYRQFPIKK